MAKSTTPNVTEFDIEKIRRFAKTELEKLRNASELPFCYQLDSGTVIVGAYKVVKINEGCWRVEDNQNQLFDFFTRKDAIFYCIALHKKDYQLASEIYKNDQQLSRLEFEARVFRYRYKKAIDDDDMWKMDLYSNKYTEVITKIEQVKKELKKSINLAKYIKVSN